MTGSQANQRDSLFMELRQVSFALDELRLFLDTHPTDASALALFGEYQARRNEILAEYSPVFGPVESYDVNTDGGWGWINATMPWETEAN